MQGNKLRLNIMVSFVLTVGIPSSLVAGYTRLCASSASDLESSARRYEMEKSNYESACGSYGYSRNDEISCGSYGYITISYKDAAERLKRRIGETYDNCGAIDDSRQYIRALVQAQKEIAELKKRLIDTEKELERFREKDLDNTPAIIPRTDLPLVPSQ